MMFVWLLCSLSARIALSQARHSSHWMVTETGLIQPRDKSQFLLTNPYDLLSFLNQDTRWENILNIYNNLIRRQKNINQLWLKLEECSKFDKYIAENEDCMQVGNIDSMDWYTSFLEDGSYKGITEKEYAIERSEYGDTDVPDCKKISSLTFSMFAFEHLDSMINRENLNATAEFVLPVLFSPLMTADQFGHWISDSLRKNSSSWLHYNLAALYWRVKGKMPKAIECSRRALHYAPRRYKDIPLLCMGTILHRSQRTEDALIVLDAALDHDPGFSISHFAKGVALATVGDYNNSSMHLNLSMKLHTQFDIARRFHHGVLCHVHLLKKIQIARRVVKEISKVLKDYTNLDTEWLKFQITFLKTMRPDEEYDYADIDEIYADMGALTGLKFKALKEDADRNFLAHCFIDSALYNDKWLKQKGPDALITARALQTIVRQLGLQTGLPTKKYLQADATRNNTEILKEIGPTPMFPDMYPDLQRLNPFTNSNLKIEPHSRFVGRESIETGRLNPVTGVLLYPPNFKVNRNRELFDRDPDWPSHKFCRENYPKFPENAELVFPVFMPFLNKGIRLENLLTEKIGLPALVQHDLPWHPPVCPSDKDLSLYTQRKGLKIHMVPDIIGKEFLRRHLLKFMSEGHYVILKKLQEAEIGQRIQTAIKKKLAKKWMLYTIASLYWRVRGNIPAALNCLLTASRTADRRYRDVVLVSLASVFMEMGLLDACSNHAEEAYKLNPYEPTTNFILAQLSMIKKNHKAHMFHLKQTIRVDERFMNGYAKKLLVEWVCILKQIDTLQELGDLEGNEICAEVEPGVSMVCQRDGTNCKISQQDCSSPQHSEKSQIVRMLELKDDTIQGGPHFQQEITQPEFDNLVEQEITQSVFDKFVDQEITQPVFDKFVDQEITQSVFDKFVEDFPKDRSDNAGHQRNYDEMMKLVNKVMEGCKKNKACWQRKPKDFDVKEADCSYQQGQLEYWIHFIGFRQELTDTEVNLPEAVAATTPSKKSVPECKVPIGYADDFFLKRIMKVDTNGWESLVRLMHQFNEIAAYRSYNSSELGAKLARYIEMNPQSWTGLIAAGWWCGASGHGQCAVRCLAAAHVLAPAKHRVLALRPLSAMLHLQGKQADAKQIAYLAFYEAPKNKDDAFRVALAHTYSADYEFAAWMYYYTMTFDDRYLAPRASLHVTLCYLVYGDTSKKTQ